MVTLLSWTWIPSSLGILIVVVRKNPFRGKNPFLEHILAIYVSYVNSNGNYEINWTY